MKQKESEGKKMRSIGKVKIKLVKKLIIEEFNKAKGLGHPDYNGVRDTVKERLPESFWNWESADAEIERIIDDTIMMCIY